MQHQHPDMWPQRTRRSSGIGNQHVAGSKRGTATSSTRVVAAATAMGMTSFWVGAFVPAYEYVTQGMARFEAEQPRSHLVQYGEDWSWR